MNHKSKIIEIKQETPSVISILFDKPLRFVYKPGQFINLVLPENKLKPPKNKHNFSLSSSPDEDFLMISFRHRESEFKKAAEKLKPNDSISFLGPMGHFLLNEEELTPAVFLTGGIGITPFYSMIKQATSSKLQKELILIYSNKDTKDVPFFDDLNKLSTENEHLNIHHTFTSDINWHGLKGRINDKTIREIVTDIHKPEYYIVGPPKMVLSFKDLLKSMKISQEKVKSEMFTGY